MTADPAGILYVVATPIGNLKDITLRAIETLKAVHLIAAEDTRHTRRLLSHYQIDAPLISCHEHNEADRVPGLIARLRQGESIALVSDAGVPSVSDPGYRLVTEAIAAGLCVTPIPGVSALTAALSASGLPTDAFTFVGFLPRKTRKRADLLRELASERRTLVFYESPQRIIRLLEDLLKIMEDRPAVAAREMTKRFEEFLRGPLSDIRDRLLERDAVKGEFTLLVKGRDMADDADPETLLQDLQSMMAAGDRPLSDIARTLAGARGLPKKTVYAQALKLKHSTQKETESHGKT